MARASELPRPVKAEVARAILNNLKAHEKAGPPEPALDAFIPELEPITIGLETHVEGKGTADNTRLLQLQRVEFADIDVDCLLRHFFYYIRVESDARGGPRVESASLLRKATAIDDMSDYVDTYIPDENRYCWDIIKTLEHPDYAPAVVAVRLPAEWIAHWKAALNESQAAFETAGLAREARGTHVSAGGDMEVEFTEIMYRLRRYIDSRADRRNKAKVAEGRALIQPLLEALQKMKVEEALRAARRDAETAKTAAPGTSS